LPQNKLFFARQNKDKGKHLRVADKLWEFTNFHNFLLQSAFPTKANQVFWSFG
jgi:hypothetical protein